MSGSLLFTQDVTQDPVDLESAPGPFGGKRIRHTSKPDVADSAKLNRLGPKHCRLVPVSIVNPDAPLSDEAIDALARLLLSQSPNQEVRDECLHDEACGRVHSDVHAAAGE